MDNMTFGKYIPGNSIIHRLDPRLKICAVFIFLISVFFDAGFIGYGILAIYVLLCSLVSKIKLSHILKAIKPMVFMMLFLMIFNIFLMKTGDVIIKIGSISIYSGALIQTAYIFIRLVLIITLTTLMTSTTKPLELTLAIESLLNPLKRFQLLEGYTTFCLCENSTSGGVELFVVVFFYDFDVVAVAEDFGSAFGEADEEVDAEGHIP